MRQSHKREEWEETKNKRKMSSKSKGEIIKKDTSFGLYLCWSLHHLQTVSQAVQSTSPLNMTLIHEDEDQRGRMDKG